MCTIISDQIIEETTENKEKELLLLFLDGYDEFNNKNIRISQIVNDRFKQYKLVKLLITIRPHYANRIELNDVFANPSMIYICPFQKN